MTDVDASLAVAPPRPARGVAARHAWTLAALAPGAILQVGWLAPGRGLGLALLVAGAFAAEAIVAGGRRSGTPRLDGGLVVAAVLAAGLMPAAAPLPAYLLAAAVLVLVGRWPWGERGDRPFHPALLALLPMLWWPGIAAPDAAIASDEVWVAAAYAAGGLALVALRIVRWQAPLSLLAALAVLALPALLAGVPATLAAWPLAAPATALVAFFVAGDGAGGAAVAPARWLHGAGIATLAAAFAGADRPDLAWIPAVLLMNLLAPAFDRWLAPARGPR